MLGSLIKAAVGTVVQLPVAVVKDTLTLGGSITNEPSAIGETLETINQNLKDSVDPDKDLLD